MTLKVGEPLNLLSLGKLCEVLQRGPGEIRRALTDCFVEPVMNLNGVSHFDESVVSLLREKFAQQRKGAKP